MKYIPLRFLNESPFQKCQIDIGETMTRLFLTLHDFECRLFQKVNSHYDKKLLNFFFRTITHTGGARFTIIVTLCLILFSSNQTRLTAIASALALTISHIPVQICKKMYPRKRPYLMLELTKYPSNPLQDHSFPSGHTTAIFSVIAPFILLAPFIGLSLLLLGIAVAISRVYLGLHYPSDVLVGAALGSFMGVVSFYLIQ
jgi:undecaprenyl-diphosphatase